MKIILCVKQVPDTSDIKWTENNTINRDGLESITNPYDLYALEAALTLKKTKDNVLVTALTMGPNQAKKMLQKILAVGADEAVLLSDKKFAGADTYATGRTIASAIKSKYNDFDLILCGQYAVDGDTAQTGPSIANFLNLPQVTYVKEILDVADGYATVLRELEEGLEKVKVKLPAVICMLKNEQELTRATINGTIKAQQQEIKVFSIEDINLSPEEAGLKGSPTYVNKAFRAEKRICNCQILENIEELVSVITYGGSGNE